MALDSNLNVYLAGGAPDVLDFPSLDLLPGFPATLGALQPLALGNNNPRTFLAKIAPSLGSPVPVPSPRALVYNAILVVNTHTTRTVELTNYGDANLSVSGISITGPAATDFSQTNNCPALLAGGVSCTASVTFSPTVNNGIRTASLVFDFGA